ncbi:MAG: hypothetical protein CMH91_09430 [Oceanicaulis sp.]|jgi:hypothetical protein|nr:hypothetical protein [Oceanicaulis sp.]MBG34493.1 hypothetical protein [Oceanicaulis sp.]HBU63080.1 hypothetical protein [Oceanicaulis sp.]|tara:strand:+ start:190 stop:414 length:225 start_codon:yes stop_codon:yes gene_type:complete
MAKKQQASLSVVVQFPGLEADFSVPELNFDRIRLRFLPHQNSQSDDQDKNNGGSDEDDRAWFLVFHLLLLAVSL